MFHKRKKENAFTLVELLTVIVILTLVLAVAVPTIANIIENAKSNTIESEAKLLVRTLNLKIMDNSAFDITSINEGNLSTINVDGSNFESLKVSTLNGKPYVYIIGQNQWDDLIVCGTYDELYVEKIGSISACEFMGNAPALASGMTPIKWVNNVETPTTSGDPEWYDYKNKLWANAKTADGSYWVWIPRYAYQIASGYQSSTEGTIRIKFLKGNTNNVVDGTTIATTPTYSGNSQTNYVLHPAFTFGTAEVTGIWVAKFEVSNNGSSKVKIIPNVGAWRGHRLDAAYNYSRSMETDGIYGWGTSGTGIDTHLIKNREWGMVAYLTQSTYGKNSEVWNNNSSTYITGCAGSKVSASSYSGCENAYNTEYGMNASTTGNITGIYDMSGGLWELVMGNLNNLGLSSGWTDAQVTALDNKYIDRYSSSINSGYNNAYFGDAYYETSYNACITTGSTSGAWYKDRSYVPVAAEPWVIRGGIYSLSTDSGLFAFYRFTGTSSATNTFRPVLMVGTGL